MVEQFNNFYFFVSINVNDIEVKNISTLIINDPSNKLELINKVVYRNTLSSFQKSGNLSLKEKSKQILLKIEEEIKSHN